MVLLDILFKMNIRPVVIYADSQMEYFESVPFIKEVCKKYGLELYIAKADITPLEQWHKQ